MQQKQLIAEMYQEFTRLLFPLTESEQEFSLAFMKISLSMYPC